MQHGGWMAEPRRCSADLKEDTPAGSHDHTRSLAQARAPGAAAAVGAIGSETTVSWIVCVADATCRLRPLITQVYTRGD